MSYRVVVVGGGITGLVAAHDLALAGADVQLLEAEDRLGGKIRTEELAGRSVDVGADAFLGRQPHARELAEELGLASDLRAPISGDVWLWIQGRLRPLPSGTVFGVPLRLGPLARSRVLSPGGFAQVAAERFRPRSDRLVGDSDVSQVVAERFGTEVVDRLVEPLLGGIYAGRADQLGVRATVPPLADAASNPGSLSRGLREHRPAASDDPVFLTVRGGLGRLIDRLRESIPQVERGVRVTSVRAAPDGWAVVTPEGERRADAVVLAVPAFRAATIVEDVSSGAARELRAIRYASVAVVSLAYPNAALRRVPSGSGLLVPRGSGALVKAVTWSSRKWPHLAGGEPFLLRASVGRIDAPPPDLPDEELVAQVVMDLSRLSGLAASPLEWRVTRWDDALPQYDVGHRERVHQAIDLLGRDAPGIHLAGAAYDGVGIAHCVRQAREVVARITR